MILATCCSLIGLLILGPLMSILVDYRDSRLLAQHLLIDPFESAFEKEAYLMGCPLVDKHHIKTRLWQIIKARDSFLLITHGNIREYLNYSDSNMVSWCRLNRLVFAEAHPVISVFSSFQ